MNETETAHAIAAGTIPSPQRIGGFSLVSLRISGTGLAMRPALREAVYRDPNVWLAPETLARCAGLPVVIDHCKGSLGPAEYEARNVGAICFAYIADRSGIQNAVGPDLWGIARLFLDPDQIAALPDLSTSPAVSFGKNDKNQTITLGDGTRCLVEASPQLIDHCAIVTEGGGVWDKGLPSESGIRADSTNNKGATTMPEEERIDPILKHLDDALAKHLAPLSARMDALEKPSKAAADAAKERADAKIRRMDAENSAWAAEDPEQARLDDLAEQKEAGDLVYAGQPAQTAADTARESRRDRAAKRRADAMPGGKPGATAQTAADAARERAEEGERADVQARCDAVAQLFGERAPAPLSGEDTVVYRKRLLRRYVKHSAQFKDADLGAIGDAATFSAVEGIIYADAVKASRTPDFHDDLLRPRVRIDPESGHRVTEFLGRTTIFKAFAPPATAITKFLTPTNRATAG